MFRVLGITGLAAALLAGPARAGDQQKTAQLQEKIEQLTKELAEQRKLAERERDGRANLAAALKTLTVELQRTREETRALQEVVKKREQEVLKQAREIEQLHNARIAAELQAKAALERAQDLLKQLEKQRPPEKGDKEGKESVERNPPAQFVKGKIVKLDPKNPNLVRVSLGADAGRQVGHTLEVYRRAPRPKYLGRIEVIQTSPREAVGRIMRTAGSDRRSPIQEGDEVASTITP